MKIQESLIPEIYQFAIKIYDGKLNQTEAISLITRENRINPGSARVLLNNFRLMRNGELYKRTNNTFVTEYFVSNIYKDFGNQGLELALDALKKHIDYFEGLRKVKRHNLRSIFQKYSVLRTENLDEIEQNEIIKTIERKNRSKENIIKELSNLKPDDSELISIKRKTYKRDNKTIALIKLLRDFKCQICSTSIKKKDGTYYVEAAHITPKYKKGRETPDNILLLCPNHHKEFDMGDLTLISKDRSSVHFTLNGNDYKLKIGTSI